MATINKHSWGNVKPPLGAQIDWSHSLSNGLVRCWLLNEGGGKQYLDLAQGGWATAQGGTIRTINSFGQNVYFDEVDSYLLDSRTPIVSGRCSIFTRCVINQSSDVFDNTAQIDRIVSISKTTSLRNNEFLIGIRNNSGNSAIAVAGARDNQAAGAYDADGTTNFWGEAGKLHSICGTFKPQSMKVYVDGKFEGEDTTDKNPVDLDAITIGCGTIFDVAPPQDLFQGNVYEVYIWNRVLSDSEIKLLSREPYAFMEAPTARQYFIYSNVVQDLWAQSWLE